MNYLRKIALVTLFVAIIFQVNAQQDKSWSLGDCIDYAIDNNLDIKRAELTKEGNAANLKQSRYERWPTFNLGGYQSVRWGRSIDPTTNTFTTETFSSNGFSANSNVTLFSGLQQLNSVKQRRKELEASEYDYQRAKNDVTLNVVAYYLDVIFAREQLENARLLLETTTAQLEQTKKLVEAGSLPVTNKLELQAQKANDEVEVINAENNVDLSLLRLKQYLQIPATEKFDIRIPVINEGDYEMKEKNVEEVYEVAERQMPEVKSAETRVQAAEIGESIAKGGGLPTLTLGGEISTNYSNTRDVEGRQIPNGDSITVPPQVIGYVEGNENEPVLSESQVIPGFDVVDGYPVPEQWEDNISYSFGLNLNIPVFNGFRVKTDKQLAKIRKHEAKINAQETKNILRQSIESAYLDAKAAKETFEAAEKQIEAQQAAYDATERSYNAGASNYMELQVATNNMFQAKSNYTRAKYDYIFKVKILDFYLGKPLTL